MPDLVLKCGAIVQLSDEDYDWACARPWRSWRKYPDSAPIVVTDEYDATGRTFRLRLLREVAARMRADFVRNAERARVSPLNGDPFDARRENLCIKIRARRRGRPFRDPRPTGHLRGKKRTDGSPRNPNASQLWNPTPAF